MSRWPTATPPPPVDSVAAYDAQVRDAVASGAALDARSVYFLARISPRYPTVEVRVADVSPTAGEAVAYAGLVRALVATAADRAAPPTRTCVPQDTLREACRSAARAGLEGTLTDPRTGAETGAWELVDALVSHVAPTLRRLGDEDTVHAVLDRLRSVGGGAARQRRLLRTGAPVAAVVAGLAVDAHHDVSEVPQARVELATFRLGGGCSIH